MATRNILDKRLSENKDIMNISLANKVAMTLSAVEHIERIKKTLHESDVFNELYLLIINDCDTRGVLSRQFVDASNRVYKIVVQNLYDLELLEWRPRVGTNGSYSKTDKLNKLLRYIKS